MSATKRATRKKASAEPTTPFTRDRGPVVTPREAADYCGCTERQIRRLMSRKELPYVKIGGLTRLLIEDVDVYLAARRIPARAQ
jgi:excisionase family DNA binding protein